MNKIIILGAGLIGKPMLLDLLEEQNLQLAIADISEKKIHELTSQYDVQGIVVDLSDRAKVHQTVMPYDYVINAVPGFMGYKTLEAVLEAGKNVVDIAFSPEDMNALHPLAVKNKVTALVDFGVAPGLSHLLAGYATTLMDELGYLRIFVGGLPKKRQKPYEYKAVFSPVDVIEEYTRPARLIRGGQIVVEKALSEVEHIEFEQLGTLEAFNSDGLRSLVHSIKVQDMAEKTLRYPGHAALMRTLRETGFFDQNEIQIGNATVKPMDLTARLLFPQWEMQEADRDLTVMKIIARGTRAGKPGLYEFELYDEFDEIKNIHSMARTTGYTATMGLRVLLSGKFNKEGVYYPEKLGVDDKILPYVLEGLQQRGIKIKQEYKEL